MAQSVVIFSYVYHARPLVLFFLLFRFRLPLFILFRQLEFCADWTFPFFFPRCYRHTSYLLLPRRFVLSFDEFGVVFFSFSFSLGSFPASIFVVLFFSDVTQAGVDGQQNVLVSFRNTWPFFPRIGRRVVNFYRSAVLNFCFRFSRMGLMSRVVVRRRFSLFCIPSFLETSEALFWFSRVVFQTRGHFR